MVFDTTTEEEIQRVSASMIGSRGPPFRFVDYERFRGKFGITPDLCALTWNRIVRKMNAKPPRIEGFNLSVVHILYGLFFLKMYPTARQSVTVLGQAVGLHQFRNSSIFVIRQIAALSNEVVSKNRKF